MVGKVPGIRNKNKRKAPPEISTSQLGELAAQEAPSAVSATPAAPSPASATQPLDQPLLWSNINDIDKDVFQLPGEHNFFSPISDLDLGIDAASLNSNSFADNDISKWFNIPSPPHTTAEHISMNRTSPTSRHRKSPSTTYPPLGPSSELGSNASNLVSNPELDNPDELKCVSTCSDTIKLLESRIGAKSQTLDEVLRVCKVSVTRLNTIINADDYERSLSCHTLVSTALNLVVSLLEKCVSVEEVPTGANASARDSRGFRFRFSLPRMSFGSFDFDTDEQIGFCSHVIRKEISRSLALVNRLKQQRMNANSQAATSTAQIQEIWCEDFENRLKKLISVIEVRPA